MLVVQVVEILWTKATRGAPRSNERAGISRTFPIEGGPCECVVQRYRIAEWEAFAPKLVKVESALSAPGSIGVLNLSSEPSGVFSLGISGTPDAGQPKRHPVLRAITLAPGEYARLSINARHTTYSGQYYSETVYNVTCGTEVAPDRFLLGPPNHELDLKANLF